MLGETSGRGSLAADEQETAAQPARCFPKDNPDPPLLEIARLIGDDSNPLMSGIQFYLSDAIDLGVPGHLNFIESKWALTGIVQSQFWGPDFVSRYGNYIVRGILSVDIAEFDIAGELEGKTLRELVEESRANKANPQKGSGHQRQDRRRDLAPDGEGAPKVGRPTPGAATRDDRNDLFPDPAPLPGPSHRLDAFAGATRLCSASATIPTPKIC